MVNSVLDMLHFRYSWNIQEEQLSRQMYAAGNQEGLEADSRYTVVGVTP